ncbi:MAG: glycosyltransferase WbuB [Nitrospiraceae bacterium]|nr:MAG: glycosyltransferase WbuB [Nitrospiraceae bacterium]
MCPALDIKDSEKTSRKLRLLFITDNFPPEINAPATRTYEHCLEWTKLGADVTVITCNPNFPQGKIYSGYSNSLLRKEITNGIKVIRVWSYIAANKGFLKRVLDYASFSITSFIAGLCLSTDIIIATSPQFFTTFSAFGLSKIKRKPWVFELRDLWPESIKAVGAMSRNNPINLLEKIELFMYRNSDIIIALTDAFKRNLVSRGIDPDKIRVIPNGSNLELFYPRKKNQEISARLGLDGKFVIGYIGTHGMAHGLEFIVNSISKISDPTIHFIFIGDGARKNEVIRLASRKHLRNITFLEPVPKNDVPDYLSTIDVSLVPLIKSETFKTVLPSKIFESAAMAIPILLGVEGQARELIEKYNAGISFKPENEDDFIDKIGVLKKNKMLYKELQNGCSMLSKEYNRKPLAMKMFHELNDVVSLRLGRNGCR